MLIPCLKCREGNTTVIIWQKGQTQPSLKLWEFCHRLNWFCPNYLHYVWVTAGISLGTLRPGMNVPADGGYCFCRCPEKTAEIRPLLPFLFSFFSLCGQERESRVRLVDSDESEINALLLPMAKNPHKGNWLMHILTLWIMSLGWCRFEWCIVY